MAWLDLWRWAKATDSKPTVRVVVEEDLIGVEVVADGDLVEMASIPCNKTRRRRVEPTAHPSHEARESQTTVWQTGSWDHEQEPHIVGRVSRNTSQTHLLNGLQ